MWDIRSFDQWFRLIKNDDTPIAIRRSAMAGFEQYCDWTKIIMTDGTSFIAKVSFNQFWAEISKPLEAN